MAYLVASVFEDSTILCIGKSAALQPEKLQRARFVADLLGVAHGTAKMPCGHSKSVCCMRRSHDLANTQGVVSCTFLSSMQCSLSPNFFM